MCVGSRPRASFREGTSLQNTVYFHSDTHNMITIIHKTRIRTENIHVVHSTGNNKYSNYTSNKYIMVNWSYPLGGVRLWVP